METHEPQKDQGFRLLRVFAPFLILLSAAILINYAMEAVYQAQQRDLAAPTPGSPRQIGTAEELLVTRPPIATAVLNLAPTAENATARATTAAAATRTPGDVAQLLGPPENSRFSRRDTISFYWQAARELQEDQQFTLYLIDSGGNEHQLATVVEANLGQLFQTSTLPAKHQLGAGSYSWEVRLGEGAQEGDLGRSERRAITLR